MARRFPVDRSEEACTLEENQDANSHSSFDCYARGGAGILLALGGPVRADVGWSQGPACQHEDRRAGPFRHLGSGFSWSRGRTTEQLGFIGPVCQESREGSHDAMGGGEIQGCQASVRRVADV